MRSIQSMSLLQEIENPIVEHWVKKLNANTRKKIDSSATFKKMKSLYDAIEIESDSEFEKTENRKKTYENALIKSNVHPQRQAENAFQQLINPFINFFFTEKKCVKKPFINTLLYANSLSARFMNKTITLVLFSEAGTDQTFVREYDHEKQKFIASGFNLDKGRHNIILLSENEILVSSTVLKKNTRANYSAEIHVVSRSQSIFSSKCVFKVNTNHLEAVADIYETSQDKYIIYIDRIDFLRNHYYLTSEHSLSSYTHIPLPTKTEIESFFEGYLLFVLNEPWFRHKTLTYPENSLISVNIKKFSALIQLKKKPILETNLWYDAGKNGKILAVKTGRNQAYLVVLHHLVTEILQLTPGTRAIRKRTLPLSPMYREISEMHITPDFLSFVSTGLLYSSTRYHYHSQHHLLTQTFPKNRYDHSYQEILLTTHSKDGTEIPFHIVSLKNIKKDSKNPAIICVYGGFGNIVSPDASLEKNKLLLDQGFILIYAHVRGGGEFGAQWHQSAIARDKQKTFDDVIAIAESLINRKYTSPQFLGMEGGSNGGLVVAACAIQRPDLFKAIYCDVPLIDMLHFHQLFVGYSWIAEYGNPEEPDQINALTQYSPLHNVKPNVHYPFFFIITSKTDDRVHPYHARALAYLLQKHKQQFFYFEKKDGGHENKSSLDEIREFTFWHLKLLYPAQQARKKANVIKRSRQTFFETEDRHAPKRRLERHSGCVH